MSVLHTFKVLAALPPDMAREVTHDANGPTPIDEDDLEEQGGTAYICQCGLSDNKPYCDGSHNDTTDEGEGELYKYEDGSRKQITEIVYEDE
jgi:CDGSH-type Zn-finger protein